MSEEIPEDLADDEAHGSDVPGPGDARDMQNPGQGEQTPDEQREEGQEADTPMEPPRPEFVREDVASERPGTTGAQPGLPA